MDIFAFIENIFVLISYVISFITPVLYILFFREKNPLFFFWIVHLSTILAFRDCMRSRPFPFSSGYNSIIDNVYILHTFVFYLGLLTNMPILSRAIKERDEWYLK